MHESGRQAVVLVDVGGSQVDGAVVCCPLGDGVWWIELDFDEDNAGVVMEEDGSVDEIVAVFCSVGEYVEQLQAKHCAVEEMVKVLKIVHGRVENKGVSMCGDEALTDGSVMLTTEEVEITSTLCERWLEFDPVFTGVDDGGKVTATKKKERK